MLSLAYSKEMMLVFKISNFACAAVFLCERLMSFQMKHLSLNFLVSPVMFNSQIINQPSL